MLLDADAAAIARQPAAPPAIVLQPAQLRLCHLHLGLDRRTKGRRRRPSEHRATARHHRALVPLRGRRRVDVIPFIRLRLLGVGTLGIASAWRPPGGAPLFDQPLAARVPAAHCARRRDRPQSDPVCILSIDAGRAGNPRARSEAGATLCDLRRGSAGAQKARAVVPASLRRRSASNQHVWHHRNDGACQLSRA